MTDQTQVLKMSTPSVQRKPKGAARAATVILGAVAALGVWGLAVASTDGPQTTMGGPTQPLAFGQVVISALLAGFAGWATLAVLERRVRAPRRRWTMLATAALGVSLAGPLTGGIDVSDRAFLLGMHLVVGVVVILGLRRTAAAVA